MTKVDCVLDAKARLGEAIVWDDRRSVLWWVDIEGRALHCYAPGDGDTKTINLPKRPGCVALREDDGFLLAMEDGFYFLDAPTEGLTHIADPEPDRPNNRFNDGACDPAGRMIAGTMPMGVREPVAAFYRLWPDLKCERLMEGFTVTNGVAFSPDGRTFYFSETEAKTRTIYAADYDPDTGAIGGRRVFFDTHGLKGRPDGGTVDSDGCYWMAGVGGWQLVRFSPKGEVDMTIDMPVEKPTKIAFGGKDLDVLYVTSIRDGIAAEDLARQPQAGGVFAVRVPGVRGLPCLRFAG